MTDNLIYLASPYSHPDPLVQNEREKVVCQLAFLLINAGYLVYCPIAETAALVRHSQSIDTGWEFWRKKDLLQLDRCDELWIADMDGWTESKGVQGEVRHAMLNSKLVSLLQFDLVNRGVEALKLILLDGCAVCRAFKKKRLYELSE